MRSANEGEAIKREDDPLMAPNTRQPSTGTPHGDAKESTSPTADRGAADVGGYVLACLILLVGGSTLRTPILNWICGPAIVVASVVFVGRITDRRAARRSTPGTASASGTPNRTTERNEGAQ